MKLREGEGARRGSRSLSTGGKLSGQLFKEPKERGEGLGKQEKPYKSIRK